MVLNATICLVLGVGRYEHITPALHDTLDWLPVPQRIQLKIAIPVFDCVCEHCLLLLPTSATSASQLPAFLVRQIFVRHNATTCLSLQQEHRSADRVSMLQPQPSGTRFHHSSAYDQLVVDSLELRCKPISSHRPADTSENIC